MRPIFIMTNSCNTSGDSFLGCDDRSVENIIAADEREVQRLGLSHARIAGRMKELRDAGTGGLGTAVQVAPHFEVTVDVARGIIACPFADAATVRKANTVVRNVSSGQEIMYSDLNIHLVECHGFYEGHGSRFRLEPAVLAAVLEV